MNAPVDRSPLRQFGFRTVLLLLLLTVSFISTYIGISEYISANYGMLDWRNQALVGFFVAMIVSLMAYAVDRAVSRRPSLFSRGVWLVLYLIIAGISVGFSYGFWWRTMEARFATNVAVAADTSRIQQGLLETNDQLSRVQTSLAALASYSQQQ